MLPVLVCGCGDFMVGPGAQDFQTDLHNGYTLCRSSVNYVVLDKKGDKPEEAIPPKLVELGVNDKFMLGKQYKLVSQNSSGSKESVDETKPLFWIIDIKAQKTYGPLDEEAFQKKKRTLGVPDDLLLKNIEAYRK